MSRLLCCLRASPDMGAALSHPQEGEASDGGMLASPPTMADVIRERKKKSGGAALGTLRRRIAAAARRPRDSRPDRGCEHARFIRGVVSSWRLSEVFLLCEQLEGGAALRDLATQAELAREPAAALHADLTAMLRERWWCDVEVAGAGWVLAAHRALLAARCGYFRELLQRYPGACRVPLEGAAASLTREEMEACVYALYAGQSALGAAPTSGTLPRRSVCESCTKWERGVSSEVELDIIGSENSTLRGGRCSCGRRVEAARLRRLGELLGFAPDSLQRDLRRLLDSGELCDTRLWWCADGAAFGFRSALELPCHRVMLAARSRFFRSVLSRQRGAVCVDEHVLPRRFARALLHAAYTDQVDLTLIVRSSSSPSSTNSTSSNGTVRGNSGRSSSIAMLDDAFQLYEIARFLEMPIVVQGCEDAIARALSADTLAHVLRWSASAHASPWVHRQAMRYLRDEFPAVMASPGGGRLPRAALADALASPFLQASEAQALRALLRWAERAAAPQRCREPNVVWHTAHAARRGRRGTRGSRAVDGALRDAVAPLASLVRLEHLPPDAEVLHQMLRRGIISPPPHAEDACSVDAWLGRGAFRPPRCFLPYLDEIKALLADQAVPEAELSRARRVRYLHRIPDTLYMVAAAREPAPCADGASEGSEGVRACVPARVLAALRARVRELRASTAAARALSLHAPDTAPVRRQIALRAVRELSLPDASAELLLTDPDPSEDRDAEEWEADRGEEEERAEDTPAPAHRSLADCCSRSGSGSLRCASASSLRSAALHVPVGGSWTAGSRQPPLERRWGRGRLSAAVPDVAMAPNANTHLLSTRDLLYQNHQSHQPHQPSQPHQPPPPVPPQPALVHHTLPEVGGMQLDLGDGATHTPRPGSRAQRAAQARHRELPQTGCVGRRDDDELRAAYELSARAYPLGAAGVRRLPARPADLLPDEYVLRSRASPSPSALNVGAPLAVTAGGAGAGTGGTGGRRRLEQRHTPPPRLSLGGVQVAEGPGRSPSPRRSPRALYAIYTRDHSRGHSPNYA